MSNVNNYKFASQLDLYKSKEVDALAKNVEDARVIMADTTRVWATPEGKEASVARLEQMKQRLARLQAFHAEGMELVKQHEALVNNLSKWYDLWWQNISNEGKQETEIMGSQADMLNSIFTEIYNELKPLSLEEMKMPKILNLK
jgi:cell division septum initiation protein DivIVA